MTGEPEPMDAQSAPKLPVQGRPRLGKIVVRIAAWAILGAAVGCLVGWYGGRFFGELNERMDPSGDPARTIYMMARNYAVLGAIIVASSAGAIAWKMEKGENGVSSSFRAER